jgi:hypothetical protein
VTLSLTGSPPTPAECNQKCACIAQCNATACDDDPLDWTIWAVPTLTACPVTSLELTRTVPAQCTRNGVAVNNDAECTKLNKQTITNQNDYECTEASTPVCQACGVGKDDEMMYGVECERKKRLNKMRIVHIELFMK